MSGCICHFCGYEIKDAAARESIKTLENGFDTALQQQQTQLDTALQQQQTQLDTALQQQQTQLDTALQQQQTEFDTAMQEADAILQSMNNSLLSVESWDSEIEANAAVEHECGGTVVAVLLMLARTQGDTMLTGIWTPATSGIANNLYGVVNTNPDSFSTTVTIENNKVSVEKSGSATMHFYATAIILGGTADV